MKYIQRFRYTLTFLALFLVWMLVRPEAPSQTFQLDGRTMGTSYQIQLWQFPEQLGENELAQQIQALIDRIDRDLMSSYAPESELSRFNRSAPGDWFAVSDETAHVVAAAREVSDLSGGYFDVTVAPLVELWGFGALEARGGIPDEALLAQVRSNIGYHQLEVRQQPPGLRKNADLRVDLGGIAKGYGADVIAVFFEELGLDSYFIEVGGELRMRGWRADGSAWVPALERPEPGSARVYEVLDTRGRALALAGSGDYRNFFEYQGQRYSHEIDPFTGHPVEHNMAAAYVIAETAMMADALTTAFMVMGPERAMAVATDRGLAAYFILRDGNDGFTEQYTSAFADYLAR